MFTGSITPISLLLATAALGFAQWNPNDVILPIEEGAGLRFDHVPLGSGPSHRRITGIVQDDLGFLWFGTDDGLKRWDGYRIRDYRHDPKDPGTLPDNYIVAISKDHSGKLWVASGRNLDVYDPATEKFTPFRAGRKDKDRVIARFGEIRQDRAGSVWLATDKGLYEVDPAAGVRFQYQHDSANAASLSSSIVRSTFETADGTFWVATTAGVDSIDRERHKVTRRVAFDMSHSVWTRIIQDHAGVIWLAYSGAHGPGLAIVDPQANELKHYRLFPEGEKTSPGVKAILEDQDGNLWVGSSTAGLSKLDLSRTHFVRYRNNPADFSTLASDQVSQVFEDREGGIWVGTVDGGVDRFTRKSLPFHRYVNEPGNPNSLDKDSVESVLLDSRGVLWIGLSRSLASLDTKTRQFQFFRSGGGPQVNGLSAVRVLSMAEDASGDLWFGTQGAGLNHLDRRVGGFKPYRHNNADPTSLSNDIVQSLHFDRAGVLWVGTDDGLNAFDAKTESFRRYAPPVKPSVYRRISEDSRGQLWLSTGWSGLQRFDPASGKFTVYRHSDARGSLGNDAVNAVCVDRSGVVWAGTQSGLNRLDIATGVFSVYNPGGSTISVDSILEDSRGNLWLGTENGLLRFDPRANTFRHYYTCDGLAANELGFSAAWKSPPGEMYFGSYGGLTVFDPLQIAEDTYVPPVRLTDVAILGQAAAIGPKAPLRESIAVAKSLVLAHAQNIFSLEFAALSYTDPARNLYRYRLEPVEKQWNEADGGRRSVTYTALPAGEYVFRVQGSNAHGVWNENGASLAISVLPPWWNTWSFRIALAAMMLCSIWGLFRLRLRQQAREFNAQLDGRVDERLRVARELHDTMLQSFQASMIFFQAGRNSVANGQPDALTALDEALQVGEQAVREGREAIQGMRSSTTIANELAQAIQALVDECNTDGSAEFRVRVEGASRNLHPILRDEVYALAREAIRNAFHHAQAKLIQAELAYGDDLRLLVRDDGKGIDPAIVKDGRTAHYGLPGMRERAARIGGTLTVRSAPGAGTEIELRVPGAKAFGSTGRFRLALFRHHKGRSKSAPAS